MISLLYCGNDRVYQGLFISAYSAALSCADALDVHILTMDLTALDQRYTPITREKADALGYALQEKNPDSRVTLHDQLEDLFLCELGDSPNLRNTYTPYAMLRLFADVLPLPQRILYLDTDTVVKGDLAPLYSSDMAGCHYAGVKDYLGRVFLSPSYVNSGVLLLDLGLCRTTGFLARCRRRVLAKKSPFPDQDALNHCARRKCFLPRKYNEQHGTKENTVIRHFSKTVRWFPFFHTLNFKPWQRQEIHRYFKEYSFDSVLDEAECLYRKTLLAPKGDIL